MKESTLARNLLQTVHLLFSVERAQKHFECMAWPQRKKRTFSAAAFIGKPQIGQDVKVEASETGGALLGALPFSASRLTDGSLSFEDEARNPRKTVSLRLRQTLLTARACSVDLEGESWHSRQAL